MGQSHHFNVHQALGGGEVADVLLWRKWHQSFVLLVASTAFWFFFEIAEYNILSFITNVLFLLVVILFFWAKSASLLNRPRPPLPDLEISEETVVKAADETRLFINYLLSFAHDVAIGGNLKLIVQLAVGSMVVSYIGGLFSFLTFIYIGILVSLSCPVLYEKYPDAIEDKINEAYGVFKGLLCRLFLPPSSNKEKKIQ